VADDESRFGLSGYHWQMTNDGQFATMIMQLETGNKNKTIRKPPATFIEFLQITVEKEKRLCGGGMPEMTAFTARAPAERNVSRE